MNNPAVVTDAVQRYRNGKKIVPKNQLSEVEMIVVRWLSLGKTYEEISTITEVHVSTIHQRVHRAMDKLGTNTAAGVVAICLRNKLIV